MNGNFMKMFKNLLKKIYKFVVKYIFYFLYGKISISKSSLINVKKKYLRNKHIKKKDLYQYNVYTIKNGRICTDGIEQVAYISQNSLLKDIAYTQIKGKLSSPKKNFVLSKGTPYFQKKINGTVVSLAQGASGDKNYFHWLFDILPRLHIVLNYIELKKINYFYMPKLKKFQIKTLTCLGFKNLKVLDSQKYKHIKAKEIIVPEHPWYHKGTIFAESSNIPKWIVYWLKDSFAHLKKEKKKDKKIFIDRSESEFKHCQFINNKEIKKILKKKGFKIVKTGQLDFISQINLFNNAKMVVGPHGAAFSNLVFCKKKTKVLEIKPFEQPNNYKIISKINKLKYNQINLPSLGDTYDNGDMYIDPNKLLKKIKILEKNV